MVTYSVEVNRETYTQKLINNVFPDIRAKFPAASTVYVQQDNAPGHRVLQDPEVVAAAGQGGMRMELFLNQPPNSPDMNILDLGFFNSIQSLQDRTTPTTIDQLVAEVERAFWAQTPATLGNPARPMNLFFFFFGPPSLLRDHGTWLSYIDHQHHPLYLNTPNVNYIPIFPNVNYISEQSVLFCVRLVVATRGSFG